MHFLHCYIMLFIINCLPYFFEQAKGNEIVISNTIRNDSGFYQCEVVSDDQIYAVGTGRLLEAPYQLECIQSFSRSLMIKWKVSDNIITAFSIHYMPDGKSEKLSFKIDSCIYILIVAS